MATDAVGQSAHHQRPRQQLSKAAGRIGDVVELINTIAGQTNLLALNATIEAATRRRGRPRLRVVGGIGSERHSAEADGQGYRRDQPARSSSIQAATEGVGRRPSR